MDEKQQRAERKRAAMEDTLERWRAVGEEIRDARNDRGLSQTELGALIGETAGVVSDDERGKDRGVPIHRLRAYAEALGIDYHMIVLMAYGRGERPGDQERPGRGTTFTRSA